MTHPFFSRAVAGVLCLVSCLVLCSIEARATTSDKIPSVTAKGAVLMEASAGSILAGWDLHKRLPMASTTKIMTALVVAEHCAPDTVVTVPPEAVGIEGSSVYLVEGEHLTVEELLYALLLSSANDAAVALAVETAGSISAFSELMNEKVAELGLSDTHFVNPNGLDDPEHYTSAYDLAMIARAALEHPLICAIVSCTRKTIPLHDVPDGRLLINHNKLLKQYEGAVGVKTGYTKKSGRSLVSAATRNGVTLICVTIGDPNDWLDHTNLLDYGFDRIESVSLARAGEFSFTVPVVGGTKSEICVTNTADINAVLSSGHGGIRSEIELPRFLYSGVPKYSEIGRIVYYCDTDGDGIEEEIACVSLTTTEDSERAAYPNFFERILRVIAEFFKSIFS